MSQDLIPNPRAHPENANLPTLNQPATIIGVAVTLLFLSVVAMGLRLWVRFRDKLWGWDDAFVVCAGLTSIAGDILVCLMPDDGLGLHLWTLDNLHLVSYFKHVYSTNIAYCLSSTCIKLSILFQFLRLFAEAMPTAERRLYVLARRITIALIVICSSWGIAFSTLAIFSCNPVSKNWYPSVSGRCVGWGSKDPDQFFTMFVGHSASNMTLDLLVLLTPVPFLPMLRLAGKSRTGLITLGILGCIVTSVAIGRMASFCINRAGTVPVLDMSFHTPIIYLFSVLELNIAIIAASIPTFWPVIAKFASNKIWVVNEIEIHVENTPRDSLSSRSKLGHSDDAWKQGKVDEFGGKTQRVSVIAKTCDRALSRQDNHHNHHRHKPSNSSLGARRNESTTGSRVSQDSQRALYPGASSGISPGSEEEDWFTQVDKSNAGGRTTTKIETFELPLAHMKARDR